jgi:hypothetical protein
MIVLFDKQIIIVGQLDVNLSPSALPCARILLVPLGFTAYLAVGGLLASYLPN